MKSFLYVLTGLLALVVAGLSIAWLVATSANKPLTEEARAKFGGLYLETEYGTLSYTHDGPMDGPVIILTHGFSTPKFVWEEVTPALVAAGYQVITYDHFGRGYSDRLEGPYDSTLFQSEISGLIQGLDLSTPLTLVGYSMGGANVIDFAASNPDSVEGLILIAPAGYLPGGGRSLINLPLVGEWVATVLIKQGVIRSIKQEVEQGLAPSGMARRFEEQANLDGYAEALLSTLRHFPMGEFAHRYRIVGASNIPVTAIWGTDDQVVPYVGAEEMAKDVPQLLLVTVKDASHSITYRQPQLVSGAILEALSH